MRDVKFQRRHFEFIANMISELNGSWFTDKKEFVEIIADKLAITNDNFDHVKFVNACK